MNVVLTGNGYLRCCDTMRKITRAAQLESPESVTATNMRKYTATVTQLLSLGEHQLEWLCKHMGHSIQIHRDFYRLIFLV